MKNFIIGIFLFVAVALGCYYFFFYVTTADAQGLIDAANKSGWDTFTGISNEAAVSRIKKYLNKSDVKKLTAFAVSGKKQSELTASELLQLKSLLNKFKS